MTTAVLEAKTTEFDVDEVEYLRHGDKPLLARVYKPRGAGPYPAMVECHGGAWCQSDRMTEKLRHQHMASHGIVSIALDFRSGNEDPYPASVQDINYAVRWTKLHARDLKTRPDLGCLYIHTTDYPMHTWPPEAAESKEHLARLDQLLGEAAAAAPDAAFLLTADHGMNYKSRCWDLAKVCARRGAPIRIAISVERDKYPKHHRGHGGVSWVYCNSVREVDRVARVLSGIEGVESVLTRSEAARLTSLISYPPDGQIPKLTPRGEELVPQFHSDDTSKVFDSPADFDAWDRCITRGLPSSMLPYNYNNGIQILQSPDYVVINLEMIHESRIVPIDGRPPLDPAIRQWLGESRGSWDGATLVVETTNFNGKVGMVIAGIPGGRRGDTPTTTGMKVTERFTRVSDGQIDYEMTVEDPEVLTDKWTVSYPMFSDPKYQFYEYACHEDNSAVRNFIVASRFDRGLAADGTPLKKKRP